MPLSDTHPGQMYINTSASYIIKVPAAATSTTSLSFPRGEVSSIVQSSLLSNQIMRDVDVPVRSPSPHVICHLISSWTDVFSSSVCQCTTTLTERITVTHTDSSQSKRARKRERLMDCRDCRGFSHQLCGQQKLNLLQQLHKKNRSSLCPNLVRGHSHKTHFCIPLQCFFKYALDEHLWSMCLEQYKVSRHVF